VVVDHKGVISSHRPFGNTSPRPCIFEQVYFSRPDLILGGQSVYQSRCQIGMELAKEAPADADLVMPVPDLACPPPSAMRSAKRHSLRTGHHPQPLWAAPSSSPATASAMPR
jgi:glutamine phosphoribosylpyrophosphate amidotransferase